MTSARKHVTCKISNVQEGVIILRMWVRYSNPLAEYTQDLIKMHTHQDEAAVLLNASGSTCFS